MLVISDALDDLISENVENGTVRTKYLESSRGETPLYQVTSGEDIVIKTLCELSKVKLGEAKVDVILNSAIPD